MKLLLKTIILLAITGLIIGYFFTEFLLELWWFSSLNLGSYFLLRESYAILVIASSSVALLITVYLNLVTIPGKLITHSADASEFFLQRHGKTAWFVSFLVSIPIIIPIYNHWESFLLFYFGATSELTDPVYSKNISYYFFSYPVYQLIQSNLFLFFSLLLSVVSGLYFAAYKHIKEGDGFPFKAKCHIAFLAFILVALQAWSIALQRIDILFEDRHLPIFYGPGFVEMNYHLPLIWLSFILFLFLTIAAVYSLYTGKKRKLAIGFALAFIIITAIKYVEFIPSMIDEYYVGSNPVSAEAKYIKNHIKATSDAFNFADITEIDYPIAQSITANINSGIRRELNNIPLWDNDLLLPTYNQLQSIRSYFNFNSVSTDRYLINNKNQQVNIAIRDLDYHNLPVNAQNWRNRHLLYTHGYGLVMSPSAQQAKRPMQWLIQNFGQSVQDKKLKIDQPEIYYGLADYPYAIVPNTESIQSENKTAGDLSTDYQGTGGLPLATDFEKAVVSGFLNDSNLFFSTGINKNSRILVRRNIYKRIKAIAPFLYLDKDAYPVLINNRIHWIVDAFTFSNRYPLVKPINLNASDNPKDYFNYARNSVKIVIDAYNGSVDFYVVDKKDPIIKTYQRLYPTLFKDVTATPKALIKHFSYPKDWFTLQMKLYAKFHQKDPEKFYQQSETLELAKMNDKVVHPYYLTFDIEELTNIPADDRQKFTLVSPLSPIGRDNLKSIALAGCLNTVHCNLHYQDDIFIYKLPDYLQVEGPAQISALIHQNTDISSQFTLWNQHGSKVIQGRMIIIPVKHALLYIQPLYLESNSAQGFPSLVKVIVAMNRVTYMADSLPLAFEGLQKKLQQASTGLLPTSTETINDD